jgi:aldehyde dehydrogenase (NAD+)
VYTIDRIYINGQFVQPHGQEWFDLYNPSKGTVIGRVRLADAHDTQAAIAAARLAFPVFTNQQGAARQMAQASA